MWASITLWFTTTFGEKLVTRLAIVALFVTLTTGLVVAIDALAATIVVSTPSWLTVPLTWLYPTNADECLSVYVSARLLKWFYDKNVNALQYR